MKKKIYISGKISGLDEEVAKSTFLTAEIMIAEQGHWEPVNPMKYDPPVPNPTWADYMRNDIKLIMDCHAMYMLDNWQESEGAKLEHHIAQKLGLTIIYTGN